MSPDERAVVILAAIVAVIGLLAMIAGPVYRARSYEDDDPGPVA